VQKKILLSLGETQTTDQGKNHFGPWIQKIVNAIYIYLYFINFHEDILCIATDDAPVMQKIG